MPSQVDSQWLVRQSCLRCSVRYWTGPLSQELMEAGVNVVIVGRTERKRYNVRDHIESIYQPLLCAEI